MVHNIKCQTLSNGLRSNRYKTPKGNEYMFNYSSLTQINDEDDVLYFLNVGNDAFVEIDKEGKILSKSKKKTPPKEESKEEEKPSDEIPMFKDKDQKNPNPFYKWDKVSLKSLDKDPQISLIKSLNKDEPIPKYEKDRVSLILELLKK